MRNGWSGGQYSLVRALLGAYLLIHFAHLLPWGVELFSNEGMIPQAELSPLIGLFPNLLRFADDPAVVLALIGAGAVASIAFGIGFADRVAALFVWFVLACLFGRNPLIANPSLPYVGWMLLAHIFLPPSPYGAWAARGRVDPGGGWRMSGGVFLASWIVLAVSYSYSGYTKLLSPSWVSGDNVLHVLNNPLARDYFLRDLFLALPPILLKLLTWAILLVELLFVLFALNRRARLWAWVTMFSVQLGFAALLNFADLTAAMILFHLFTFDPAWIRGRVARSPVLHYDGTCALCHGVVRFLLAEDRHAQIRFAPLQGSAFDRADGYDTIVLVDANERLERSAAIIRCLEILGGYWRLLGMALRFLPRSVADAGYSLVGRSRYRLFGMAPTLCPVLPPHLRARFQS